MTILAWCIAWVLDFIIGDPQHWPHPVRWIGRLITFVQRIVRRYCPGDKALRIGGGVMWVCGCRGRPGAWHGAYWRWRSGFHPWFGWSVEVWMIFTTLAGRSLARAAQEVERPLRENGPCGKPNKTLLDRRARYVATSASADQSRRGGNGCRKHR